MVVYGYIQRNHIKKYSVGCPEENVKVLILTFSPEVKWEDEEPREIILKPIKDE